MVSLSQLSTYFIVLMPVIVSLVAGAIRQDKLPALVNEGISYAVTLILALLQALFGGKLSGNPYADFGIVAAYTLANLHNPLFQKLQLKIQTNVLSTGKAPPQPVAPQPQIVFDVQKVAETLIGYLSSPAIAASIVQQLPMQQLAAMLKNELIQAGKVVPASQVPKIQTQSVPVVNTGVPGTAVQTPIIQVSPPAQGG